MSWTSPRSAPCTRSPNGSSPGTRSRPGSRPGSRCSTRWDPRSPVDDRWAVIQRRLLDDDDIGDVLVPALAIGIKLDQLRSLARAFNTDWDLIEDRIVGDAAEPAAARRHARSSPKRADVARSGRPLPGRRRHAAAGSSGSSVTVAARYQPHRSMPTSSTTSCVPSPISSPATGGRPQLAQGLDLAGLRAT